jgi:diguanylate cyclase (GGDEF)-like protein
MGESAVGPAIRASTDPLLRWIAFGSLLAGVIHVGVCPEHFREATLFGVFFVVVALAQMGWAARILSHPGPALLIGGAIGQAATVGVWLMSRAVGIPVGPGAWQRERLDVTGLAASLIEVAVAVAALRWAADHAAPSAVTPRSLWSRFAASLPQGSALPDDVWAQRHRWILTTLWLHVPAIVLYSFVRGSSATKLVVEAAILTAPALAATALGRKRRIATVVTAMGLLTCSAVLVFASEGLIEMHFHYFVVVGIITLYQDWWPFLVAIGYVVVQHGVAGAVDPRWVYNHQEAVANPWQWAGIHGMFILAMSSAGIVSWRLNETLLSGVVDREHKLSDAQRVARMGSWQWDAKTGQSEWSEGLMALLGLEEGLEPPTAEDFFARVHPDDLPELQAGFQAVAESGKGLLMDARIVQPDGTVAWFQCRAAATMSDGEVSRISGTFQEITSRKEAEASLRGTLSLLEATLDATDDGILVVDNAGQIKSFNRRFVELWRLPESILASHNDDDALAFVVSQLSDPRSFLAKVRELYANPEANSNDVLHFRDGRIFERLSRPQRLGDEIVGRVWSFRDITERARLEGELVHQAFHDALTGLANQSLFRDRVEHALRRIERQGGRLAVLFLDLDDFKTVNDSLGHNAGDALLRAVASRLSDCVRATDTAARLGGDEFAILIEDLGDDTEAVASAERIKHALSLPFHPGGRELHVGASIGIVFAGPNSTSEQLLRNADLAMYAAKAEGKNRHAVFQEGMHQAALGRLELEADLRRALSSSELEVHYQPVVSLADQKLVGAEALVRWLHPERGLLGPGAFIEVAEATGLIVELGHHVLQVACHQARRWQMENPEHGSFRINVNVSPRQLFDVGLVRQVRTALDESGLAPEHLVLEIVETAMMRDTAAAVSQLNELKALGVRIAVDDFGTGYSSLSYLEQFPVDYLKIDQSFVATISDSGAGSLAEAIVSMASTLDLLAVSEGIETDAQMQELRAMGCPLGQGYLFARPMSAAELGVLLAGSATPAASAPTTA